MKRSTPVLIAAAALLVLPFIGKYLPQRTTNSAESPEHIPEHIEVTESSEATQTNQDHLDAYKAQYNEYVELVGPERATQHWKAGAEAIENQIASFKKQGVSAEAIAQRQQDLAAWKKAANSHDTDRAFTTEELCKKVGQIIGVTVTNQGKELIFDAGSQNNAKRIVEIVYNHYSSREERIYITNNQGDSEAFFGRKNTMSGPNINISAIQSSTVRIGGFGETRKQQEKNLEALRDIAPQIKDILSATKSTPAPKIDTSPTMAKDWLTRSSTPTATPIQRV